jgi:hypothetical protein
MFFLKPESSSIPAEPICATEWLADQVLERIRERMTSVEDESKMRESFRYPHFFQRFIEQKSARSVNFSLTIV